MKSRLEQNLSELWTLKNQIRLELNQIRPHRQYVPYAKEKSKRKYFPAAYRVTNVTEPREEPSCEKKKKIFEKREITNSEMSKSYEKKHFPLATQNTIQFSQVKRRSSAYFHRQVSADRNINLFLIGGNAKGSPQKKGRRIIPGKHTYKADLIHNS